MAELFVGREGELGSLEGALASAMGGAGRFVLINGEAGIGKTCLCDELQRRAEATGFVAAWGRSWESEGTPAYWPWLQVLRRLGLAHLLVAGPTAGDPEQARFALFDVVAGALAEAASRAPLLLVLDDLHSADVSSLLLLEFVARTLRGTSILVIGTSRESASPHLARATREASLIALGRLSRAEVARWVSAAGQPAVDAEALFASSEGNPLFLSQLLATARKRPGTALAGGSLPAGVRAAIRAHLATLSERAQWVLEAASVLGRELELSALLGLVGDAERPRIDEACAAGVLHALGDDRLRFSHVLLRDELYANLAPGRRHELHGVAAARFARDAAVQAAAHHTLLSAPDDGAAASQLVLAAVRDAMGRLAFEDACSLAERGLAVLKEKLAARDAAALWLAVGEARLSVEDGGPGRDACVRAVELGEQVGDLALVARAALVFAGEPTFGRDHEALAMLRRALNVPRTEASLRVQVLGRLAMGLVGGDPRERDEYLAVRTEAFEIARSSHDAAALLVAAGVSAYFPETLPLAERIALNAEAIRVGERLKQVPRIAHLLGWQVTSLIEAEDLPGALALIAHSERLLAAFPQPQYRWRVPLIKAMLANLQGRFDEGDALHREVFRSCAEHGVVEGLRTAATARISAAYNRGDASDLADYVPRFHELLKFQPNAELFFSIFEAHLYGPEKVERSLAMLTQTALETIPGPAVLAWASVHAGVTRYAQLFYDALEPRLRNVKIQFGPGGMSSVGPNGLLLGRLAAQLGRRDEAIAHYARGLEVARRVEARPYVAHTQLAWAALDPASARERLGEALELARSLGMVNVAAQAEAALGERPRAVAVPAGRASLELAVTRDGELWVLVAGPHRVLLRDAKGLQYLAALVGSPHVDVHVLELIGAEEDTDAGPLLDDKAKQAYRARAESLRDELEEAQANHDPGREAHKRAELEALATELSRAVGLGGRNRRAGSTAERARINVQRRLRDVVRRVAEVDAVLGRHLELSVKTGQTCRYAPTWP